MSQMPPELQERIIAIQTKHKVSQEEVMSELQKLYMGKFIQNDETLPTAEAKLAFSVRVLESKFDRYVKFDPYNVITTGIGKCIKLKNGSQRQDVFVAVQEDNNLVNRSITFKGSNLEHLKNVQTLYGFNNVKLGKFPSGEFQGDERTLFENPQNIAMSPVQLLDQLKVKRCTIAQTIHNLAKVDKTSSGEYVRRTDWRVIKGMISNHYKGISKKGQELANYTITDGSLDDDFTSPEGVTIKKQFTVWCNPLLVTWEKNNEIDLCGPISIYDNNVQMEAYLVLPVHTPFGAIGGE